MTVHGGKQVIGSVQYCAVNKSHYAKGSMTVHGGKEDTSSVQYCTTNKSPCGQAALQIMRENRSQVQCIIML